MVKTIKYFVLSLVLIFVLVSNFTYLNVYLPQCYPFRYCANKCDFEMNERGKRRDPFGDVEMEFEKYKWDAQNRNLKLHRRFYRKWWQVWNWYDFITHRRWRCPYAANDADT